MFDADKQRKLVLCSVSPRYSKLLQGGRTSASDSSETASVEVFSAGRHAWHPASPMTAARHAHAAAALGGRVYAVGGQNSRAVHASCEWRDVGSGHWFLDTPMSIERKYTAAAVHAGITPLVWHTTQMASDVVVDVSLPFILACVPDGACLSHEYLGQA